MAKELKIVVDFVDVKKNDLETISKHSEPDLVIVDHKLENIQTGIFRTGSTAAAYIRELWSECPVVCVTGMNKTDLDSQQRPYYEDIFEINNISKYYNSILSIARSFNLIKTKRPSNSEDLLQLLKAPKEDYERLKAVLPHNIKSDFSTDNKGLIFDISYWIRNVLIERPGFLYDSLWVATYLGLKPEALKKVEEHFINAEYNGLFSTETDKRWWKTKVLQLLSQKVADFGLPWEKGRHLPNLLKKDYSKCYATKADYPETVAFTDDTENAKRVQMRIYSTVSHPSYENLMFFEEIRMMK